MVRLPCKVLQPRNEMTTLNALLWGKTSARSQDTSQFSLFGNTRELHACLQSWASTCIQLRLLQWTVGNETRQTKKGAHFD